MITYVVDDLFRSPAKVLVNTVNTKGVMGKGLAKDFKAIYPNMFLAYQKLCDSKQLDIGKLQLFRTPHKWVLNFPTKRDWRHPSKPEYIEAGLKAFVAGYARNDITGVAFPQLGCGHGDLDWEQQVQPLMERYLAKLPISVFIHLYRKDAFPKEHTSIEDTRRWLHGEPESLGFQEVWEDIVSLFKSGETWLWLSQRPAIQATRLAKVFDDGEGLGFRVGESGEFEISKDLLLEVWQHFRSSGVLLPNTLPHGLEKHAAGLFALFGQLPYVRKVEVVQGRTPASVNFVAALQLTPRTVEESLVLPLMPRATTAHA